MLLPFIGNLWIEVLIVLLSAAFIQILFFFLLSAIFSTQRVHTIAAALTVLVLITLSYFHRSLTKSWADRFALLGTPIETGHSIRQIIVATMIWVWSGRCVLQQAVRLILGQNDPRFWVNDPTAAKTEWPSCYHEITPANKRKRKRAIGCMAGSASNYIWTWNALVLWVLVTPSPAYAIVIVQPATLGQSSVFKPWSDWIGAILYISGFLTDSIADLQRVIHNHRRTFTDRGLWRYSRHPDYFGQTLLWLGVLVFCVAGATRSWHLAFSIAPLVNFILLFTFFGVLPLEREMSNRYRSIPYYQRYCSRTSLFVPWRPKRVSDSSSETTSSSSARDWHEGDEKQAAVPRRMPLHTQSAMPPRKPAPRSSSKSGSGGPEASRKGKEVLRMARPSETPTEEQSTPAGGVGAVEGPRTVPDHTCVVVPESVKKSLRHPGGRKRGGSEQHDEIFEVTAEAHDEPSAGDVSEDSSYIKDWGSSRSISPASEIVSLASETSSGIETESDAMREASRDVGPQKRRRLLWGFGRLKKPSRPCAVINEEVLRRAIFGNLRHYSLAPPHFASRARGSGGIEAASPSDSSSSDFVPLAEGTGQQHQSGSPRGHGFIPRLPDPTLRPSSGQDDERDERYRGYTESGQMAFSNTRALPSKPLSVRVVTSPRLTRSSEGDRRSGGDSRRSRLLSWKGDAGCMYDPHSRLYDSLHHRDTH